MIDDKQRKELIAHNGWVHIFVKISSIISAWGSAPEEWGLEEGINPDEIARFYRAPEQRSWSLERDPDDTRIWHTYLTELEDDEVMAVIPEWVEVT